jgi:hypothetical protein
MVCAALLRKLNSTVPPEKPPLSPEDSTVGTNLPPIFLSFIADLPHYTLLNKAERQRTRS